MCISLFSLSKRWNSERYDIKLLRTNLHEIIFSPTSSCRFLFVAAITRICLSFPLCFYFSHRVSCRNTSSFACRFQEIPQFHAEKLFPYGAASNKPTFPPFFPPVKFLLHTQIALIQSNFLNSTTINRNKRLR